jgi:hypothetical protein
MCETQEIGRLPTAPHRLIGTKSTRMHTQITIIDPASIMNNNLLVTRRRNQKRNDTIRYDTIRSNDTKRHYFNISRMLVSFSSQLWHVAFFYETKIKSFAKTFRGKMINCLLLCCALPRTFRFRRIDRSRGISRVWVVVSHLQWKPLLRYRRRRQRPARQRCCTGNGSYSCCCGHIVVLSEQRIGLPVAPTQSRERVPTGGSRKFRIE